MSFGQKAKFIEPYDEMKYQGPMLSQEVFCNVSLGVLNHNCRSTYLQNKEAQIFLGKLKIDWGKGALPHFQGRAGIILREGYSLRRGNTVWYEGSRRTLCRTWSWFFSPTSRVGSMVQQKQKMSKTTYSCMRNLSHPQGFCGSEVTTNFVHRRIVSRLLWSVAPCNDASAPQTWKFHSKELFFLFHLVYDVHMLPISLPFEKNQDLKKI